MCLCVTLPNTASCKLTVNGLQKNLNRLGQNYKSCNTVLGRYISAAFFRGPSPNKTPPSPSHLTRGSVIFHFRFSRTDVSRNVITMKFIFQKTCRNSLRCEQIHDGQKCQWPIFNLRCDCFFT